MTDQTEQGTGRPFLHLPNISRRRFIGGAGASIVSTSMLSATASLPFMSAAAAQNADPDDYRAVVCLFLAGGNDSWNMLVPTDDATYNRYSAARTDMSLLREGDPDEPSLRGPILPLNAVDVEPGRSFGVHPAMPEVRDLFDTGAIGFVANVGTLVTPLASAAEYNSGSFPIPRALFSHNDQINQWHTAYPQGQGSWGWAGSVADVLQGSFNHDAKVAMNISLAGSSLLLSGRQTDHYAIGANGSVPINGKTSGANTTRGLRYEAFAGDSAQLGAFAAQPYRNVFEQAYLDEMTGSVALETEFSSAFDNSIVLTPFDGSNRLEATLIGVARTIKARQALGTQRQVFFVQVGGWDHHQELHQAHNDLLGQVSRGLKTFWEALGEDGVEAQDNTVVFTASDFGRTLRSNGRGTDHAWGGHHIVMGGPVRGQRIHGSYPTPAEIGLGEGLDVGTNGRVLPTTAVDQYIGEICHWFGVPDDRMHEVLPNYRNFVATGTMRPLGFLTEDLVPSSAQFALSCVTGNGLFHVTVVNGGPEAAGFAVDVTGLPRRVRTLAVGEDFRFGFSGRPDGPYTIDVYRNGQLLDSEEFDVACDPVFPVLVEHSCLAGNGRVDVHLRNLGGATATYRVSITGLAPRTQVLDPGDRARISFTGRPDGDYTVSVVRDGAEVHDEVVTIACDLAQTKPVVVSHSCLAGMGRVDVDLLNRGTGTAKFEVLVGALAPRVRTLAPGATQRVSVTGRPDGTLPVEVFRSGTLIHSETVVIACGIPD